MYICFVLEIEELTVWLRTSCVVNLLKLKES